MTDMKARTTKPKSSFNMVIDQVADRYVTFDQLTKAIFEDIWLVNIMVWVWSMEHWWSGEKKIEVAEMQLLRISWVERTSNESVLQRAGTRRENMRSIRQRQLKFLGHIMRDRKFESTCRLEGKMEDVEEADLDWNTSKV